MKKWLIRFQHRFFSTCSRTINLKVLKINPAIRLLLFPVMGLMALIWILIRVIPKPSRAIYPCMKVAAPIASTFIAYVVAALVSVFSIKKAKNALRQKRYQMVILFSFFIVFSIGWMVFQPAREMFANTEYTGTFVDSLGPNNPIGEAKEILPGRVVWVHDPNATNENCVPDKWGDGYFLDKNADQDVIDNMFSQALLSLTGATTDSAAWDVVFKYFNQEHGKSEVDYQNGETIFIKINAVHAWNTSWDGSILNNSSYGNVDTSPQAVMTMFRQLVYNAGVPQENIYIGDPYTHIFNHCLEKWRTEFPNIHYMDKSGRDGREKYTASDNYTMYFSDRGTVISEQRDKFFTVMEDADYLLSIPAMKGHRWGGVTFFGKNFFGANTRSGAVYMHSALHREDYDKPLRGDYGMYRVFVDLMAHENIGGKSLIYFMDALWACSYEHEPPVKFQMAPFNNDWCSSILLSLDPLAIESVCLDIMQAEFPKTETEEPGNYWYANFPAIDDYLHQAADSTWWPEGITYDPENDGTPISSLGVHEHWNNPTDRKYTRNLETGDGIELIEISKSSAVEEKPFSQTLPEGFVLYQNYPNPFNTNTIITFQLQKTNHITLKIYNANGEEVAQLISEKLTPGQYNFECDACSFSSGIYYYQLKADKFVATKKMVLLK